MELEASIGQDKGFLYLNSRLLFFENWFVQLEIFEKGCIKKEAFEFKYVLFGLDVSLKINVSLKSHVNMWFVYTKELLHKSVFNLL